MKIILAMIGAVVAHTHKHRVTDVYEGDETNAKTLWKNDWAYYREHHAEDGSDPMDTNNCRLRESKNFLGA